MNILIVEDNKKLARNIATVLRKQKYNVDLAFVGGDGLEMAQINSYGLVILDLALPDIDGVEVCCTLREEESSVPILMLTARVDLHSKVNGLDSGADDYLTKPFLMDELLARVRALMRRASKCKKSSIKLGSVTIDLAGKTVKKDGGNIKLSPREMGLLEFLVFNKGKTKSASEIYESVWGSHDSDILFSDTLKVHVANLRKKLGKGILKTVTGFGYVIE